MNVSARIHPLIICIGNPLRGDDSLGWVVAEQLSRESNPGFDIYTVYQLTPELAQWMAAVDLVIQKIPSIRAVVCQLCVHGLLA